MRYTCTTFVNQSQSLKLYFQDKYLSYKYKICQDDWFADINLLIAKIKVHFEKETQSRSIAHTIVELCDIYIRDGIAN